ncbi:MAG: hypothetical protein ABH856_03060 [Patescibacteria group bacterium]|nr:hypothetical protein [Patescibacteria group bacterium]
MTLFGKSDSPETPGKELTKSQIVGNILGKITNQLKNMERMVAAIDFTRAGGRNFMFNIVHRNLRGGFNALVDNLPKFGMNYNYSPSELIWISIQLSKELGAFTDEELKILNGNEVVFWKLIFERIPKVAEKTKKTQQEPHQEYRDTTVGRLVDALVDNVENGVVMARESISKALLWLSGGTDVVTEAENGEEQESAEESGPEIIDPSNLHELTLLNMDLTNWKNALRNTKWDSDEEDIEGYYRRILDVRKSASLDDIRGLIATEDKLMKEVNEMWDRSLEYYYDQEEADRYRFGDDVSTCNSLFDLYDVMAHPSNFHEFNSARLKLILFLSVAKVMNSHAYRKREKIKKYQDDYLMNDVFEADKFKKVKLYIDVQQSDRGEKVDISLVQREGYLDYEVWETVIKDPVTGDEEEVYIYVGGDENDPKDEKSGVVNAKSRIKLALKRLLIGKEPIDTHRITVIPKTNTVEALKKVRNIMGKTITHPQSRDLAWVAEKETDANQASAGGYIETQAETVDVILSSYHEGTVDREYTMRLEVRSGLHGLFAEHHPNSMLNHGIYTQIRMLPILPKMLPPKYYEENWLPVLDEALLTMYKKITDGNPILAGILFKRYQEIKLKTVQQARKTLKLDS